MEFITFKGIITNKSGVETFTMSGSSHIHLKVTIEAPDGQSLEADVYDKMCTQPYYIGDQVEVKLEIHVIAGKKYSFNKLKIREIKKV